MNKNKINIRFLSVKIKQTRKECPIRCRITYNKNRKEFSTGLFINPDFGTVQHQLTEATQ